MKNSNKNKFNKNMLIMSTILGAITLTPLYADESTASYYDAIAVTPSIYAGASAIQSTLKPKVIGTNTTIKNDTSTGYKAYVGYNINSAFAIEGAYYDLGSVSLSRGTNNAKLKYTSMSLQAVGKTPLSANTDLFGKAGIAVLSNSMSNNSITYRKVNNISAIFGVGTEYYLNQGLSVRAEYEHVGKDYQAMSLGMSVKLY